jgi:hypothetical protein
MIYYILCYSMHLVSSNIAKTLSIGLPPRSSSLVLYHFRNNNYFNYIHTKRRSSEASVEHTHYNIFRNESS